MPYALVGTYPTGRSRILKLSGTWGGDAYAEWDGIPWPLRYGQHANQVFSPAFWDMACTSAHQPDISLGADWIPLSGGLFGIYGGFGADWLPYFTFDGPYRFAVAKTSQTPLQSYNFSGGGEWYVLMETAEYFNVYVETDDLGNPVFPNYGGAITTDTPYSNWIQFFEIIPVGGKVTVGCNFTGGGDSVSAEIIGTCAYPAPVPYTVYGFTGAYAFNVFFPGRDYARAEARAYLTSDNDTTIYALTNDYNADRDGGGVTGCGGTFVATGKSFNTYCWTDHSGANGVTDVWMVSAVAFAPALRYRLKGRVFAMEEGYPEIARVTVRGASGLVDNPIPATPDFSLEDELRYGQCYSVFEFKASLVYKRPPEAFAIDERSAIAAYMTPSGLLANGEDTSDWRMLQRGLAFDSCQVTQDELQLVDDGSALQQDSANQKAGQWSGIAPATVSSDGSVLTITTADLEQPGSATRNFADEGTNGNAWAGADFMGYRWLRLRIRGTSADNQVFTLSIANARDTKTWSLTTGAKDAWTDVYVDLCYPDSESAATDDKDSKWPLSGDSQQGHIDDSAYWGVSEVASLSLTNLGRNQVYELDSITLEARSHQRLNILPVFNQWVQEADDDTDPYIYEARRLLWGDTDGRISLENPDMRRNLALQDLQTYTITGEINRVNGLLDGRPTSGWEAVAVAELPTDGYHNNDTLDACCLWGQGAFWGKLRGDSEPRWHIGLDIDASE